jgi:hypothetical protein
MSIAQSSDLCGHIKDVLFVRWKKQRKDLEDKWNRNRAAFVRDVDYDPQGCWKRDEKAGKWSSDTFHSITKQKCVSASAIVADMLLKGGQVNFTLIPDELDGEREGMGGEAAVDKEIANVVSEEEQRINRQLELCKGDRELEKCIIAGSIYGRAYTKRYVRIHDEESFSETEPGSGVWELNAHNETNPAFEYKSCWNIFHDLESTDPRLRDCDGLIERDYISLQTLRGLAKKPFYLPKTIKQVLDRMAGIAPGRSDSDGSDDPALRDLAERSNSIQRLEFWGQVPRYKAIAFEDELEVARVPVERDPEDQSLRRQADESDLIEVHVVIADDKIIRYVRCDPKSRPYDMCDWESSIATLGGISVADNVEAEQKVLNGAVRNLEDNSKRSAALILAGKRSMLTYSDSIDNPTKYGNFIDIDEDAKSVTDAIQQFKVEDMSGPLLTVIKLFLEFADLSSMIPRIEQGEGEPGPQTAFELRERLEKAGKYLGRVIMSYDTMVENIVEAFYRTNMLNPEIRTGKGRYRVKALGFYSFENRYMRVQRLTQILTMLLQNPDLKAISKIRYLWEEVIKASDLDPKMIVKNSSELMAEAEQQAQALESQRAALGEQPNEAGLADLQAREAEIMRLQAEVDEKSASADLKRAQADEKRTQTTIAKARAVQQIAGSIQPEPQPVAPPEEPVVPQAAV